MPSRPSSERGSATLELVLVFPAVLLLVFGIVQGGLWYHARSVAALAAAEGLRAAQAIDGSAGAGTERAAATLQRTGAAGFLHAVSTTAQRGPMTAQVTVKGTAVALFPGLGLPVGQTATGPIERLLETP